MSWPAGATRSTRPDAEDFQAIRAIQFSDPPDLSEIVPTISDRAEKRDRDLPGEESGARYNTPPKCVKH